MSGAPDQWADFRYQGQSKFAGQSGTDLQKAYATGNAPYVDPTQPVGSARHPSYDTPDLTGQPGTWHVTQDGQMVNDKGQVADPIQHDWSAFKAHEPRMATGEDMARTAPGALARGVAGLGGVLGDAQNLGQKGFNWVADHAMGAAQDLTGNDFGVAHHPHTEAPYQGIMDGGGLTSADLNQGVQGLFGAYHQPQTMGGRAVDTVGQMAPAALLPGGPAARLARVLIPAATSETAGEMFRDSNNPGGTSESVARLIGALGGAGVQGFGESVANAPYKMFRQAQGEMTPDALVHALATQQSAASLPGGGLHITLPEASNSKGMLALQHFAENSPHGQPQTAPLFQARPQQVDNVVRALADRIAPADTAPGVRAAANQAGAEGVIGDARRGVNAAATPFYDALQSQTMHSDAYRVLAADPSYARALADLRGQPEINAPYAHLPDANMAVINEVQKQQRANIAAARPGEMNPTGNHQLEAARMGASSLADQLARHFSPDYAQAHDTVSAGMAANVDPLRAGPVGVIATKPSIPAQVGAMFPKNAVEGSADQTAVAANALPEDVTRNLTRHHIIDNLNTSNADLQSGPNQWGGANLAKALVGHDERAAALQRTLDAIDPTGALSAHSNDLMGGLQATGRRMQPGSGTAFNEQRAGALGSNPGRFLSKLIDPLEWGKNIDNAVGGALYRRNVDMIVRLLHATPDEAARILARSQPGGGAMGAQALPAANGARQ